jgi:hypothetical protein
MATGVELSDGDTRRVASAAAGAAVQAAVEAGHATVTVTPATPVRRPRQEPMDAWERLLLGWMMILLPLLLLTQLIALWPSVAAATTSGVGQPKMVWLFGAVHSTTLSPDSALLVLVAFVGAFASLGEVSFRFAANAGRGQLSKRWIWTYLLRPVQGATLATIVYFALRGGLLGVNTESSLNPYGLAAFAGLVGLFTRQAFQKLKDVFNMLWSVDDLDAGLEPDETEETHDEPSALDRIRARLHVGRQENRSSSGTQPADPEHKDEGETDPSTRPGGA